MTAVAEPTVTSTPTVTLTETPVAQHWTGEMLKLLPQVLGERYEVIDGELYVTRRPHSRHQFVIGAIFLKLENWSRQTNLGRTLVEPGLVYAKNQAVAPDLVWIGIERLTSIFDQDGHLAGSPEIIIEVLSGTKADVERDRDTKLALYSRQNVQEYWIADWRAATIDLYRHDQQQLVLVATLHRTATLTSPLLPGFTCLVGSLFEE